MKEKLHKDVAKVGETQFYHHDIKPLEAVAISLVAVLAISVGTIYGTLLF